MEHFERFPIEMEREYIEDENVEHILAMYQDQPTINYIDPIVNDIQVIVHDSKRLLLVHHEWHNKDLNVELLSVWSDVQHQHNDYKIH